MPWLVLAALSALVRLRSLRTRCFAKVTNFFNNMFCVSQKFTKFANVKTKGATTAPHESELMQVTKSTFYDFLVIQTI